MADKPTVDVSWATLTAYPDGTPTITEPSAGEKAQGQEVGEPVLAQYLNFLFNGIWQWVVWLMNFESTAHTWTAQQTFTGTTLFSAGTGAVAGPGAQGFLATGETNTSTNGSARGGIGGQATGGNATAGTGAGGDGLKGTGGIPFNGGIPGNGVFGVGATINGATDSVSIPGAGGRFVGGSVTSDTAGREGANAIYATAGNAQDGYGAAFYADHGGIQIDDGSVNISGQFSGDSLNLTGAATIQGGIVMSAVTLHPSGSFTNGFSTSTPAAGYVKDGFAFSHLSGGASPGSGGNSGQVAFNLPAPYRPLVTYEQDIGTSGFTIGQKAHIVIATNGDVAISFSGSGVPSTIFLDGIHYLCAV